MLNQRGKYLEKYGNCNANKLKRIYNRIVKKNYCFSKKEKQMKSDISESIYGSSNLSFNASKCTLRMSKYAIDRELSEINQLIKQKTGEEYSCEEQLYFYSADDLIDFVISKKKNQLLNEAIKHFANNLNDDDYNSVEKIDELRNSLQKNQSTNLSESEIEDRVDKAKQYYKICFLIKLFNKTNSRTLNRFCKDALIENDPDALYKKYNSRLDSYLE